MPILPYEIIDIILFYLDNIDICIELKRYYPLKSKISIEEASRDGHLEIVKYLHATGTDCNAYVMILASCRGHLEIVKYLHYINVKCPTDAMNMASTYGHLEVIKYL